MTHFRGWAGTSSLASDVQSSRRNRSPRAPPSLPHPAREHSDDASARHKQDQLFILEDHVPHTHLLRGILRALPRSGEGNRTQRGTLAPTYLLFMLDPRL